MAQIVAQNVVNIYDLAVDGSYVYWTGGLTPQDTNLYRKSIAIGAPTIISSLGNMKSEIVVKNGKVFWGDPANGIYFCE